MDIENLGSSVVLGESVSNDNMTRPHDDHDQLIFVIRLIRAAAAAAATNLTRGTSMTSLSQVQNTPPYQNQHQNQKSHPIIVILQQQGLGAAVFMNAVTIITGIFLLFYCSETKPLAVQLVVIALTFGCAFIWNGILFRKAYPKTAHAVEQFGIAIVLLAFIGMVALFLPVYLLWMKERAHAN
ncbi:hypothetical protein F0562_033055 [Nyssa sinensis]|uniref:Uncharacterized protein n=1 Tax=Nyssa sinensis TaxID=561372 RepID=A0A5J5ARG3_9ASTE|nr:hypothetical protein F0562_033055 [Nyssa sinensis]